MVGITRTFVVLLVALAMFSCANQITPQGGPKDTTKPRSTVQKPPNGSVNFTGNTITLTFDEYVNIDNAFNQVVISPPMDEFPSFQMRGKNLVIKFKEELHPNTTYTINFGESIKDITEGNVADNLTYVFSTGPKLDSLFIDGKVVDSYTGQPMENVLVMLYDQLEDSVVYKQKPYYFSKTDKNGDFKIEHIKEGHYKVFALEDANFNLLYDLPSEKISFLLGDLLLDSDSTAHLHLALFKEDKGTLHLLSYDTKTPGRIDLYYSDSVKTTKLTPISGAPGNIIGLEENSSKDTITYWYSYGYASNSLLQIAANNQLTDTIDIAAGIPSQAESPFKSLKPSGPLPTNILPKSSVDILFERPISKLNSEGVMLLEDSMSVSPNKVELTGLRTLRIAHNWKEGSEYQIIIPDSTVFDSYGLTNDTISFVAQAVNSSSLGMFNVTVEQLDPAGQYLLLLYKDKNVVDRKILTGRDKFEFELQNMVPGSYVIRVVQDLDKSGSWTTGDYLKGRLPEKVYAYPQALSLKANWEMDVVVTPKY